MSQKIFPPLRVDPYEASSLLQKAIRRGCIELAIQAAEALYKYRGRAVWHRLATIAFEDVGLGAPTLVSRILCAQERDGRENVVSELEMIRSYCRELAAAPKCRAADHLFSAAQRELGNLVLGAEWSTADCISIAADPDRSLIERAAGLLRPEVAGKPLSRSALVHRLECLDAFMHPGAAEWTMPSVAAVQRLKHSFAGLLPLLATVQKEDGAPTQVTEEETPRPEDIDGLPSYVLDKHTGLGKRAIYEFAHANEEVASTLRLHVLPGTFPSVVAIAVFFADGAPVNRRLEWSRSAALERAGIEADMLGAGCPVAGVQPVMNAVVRNLVHLNAIRRQFRVGGSAR